MKNPAGDILHRLDQRQFDKALDILTEEQTANRLTRAQRIFYRLLTVDAYVFIFITIVIFALGLLSSWQQFDWTPKAMTPVFIGFTISFLFILPLCALNSSLLLKAYHQARLIRKLNLRALYAMSWRAQKKKRRLIRLLFPLIVIGAFLMVLPFIKQEQIKVLEVIYFGILGLALIEVYFILLWKNKMDIMMNMDNLKQALVEYRSAAQEGKKDFVEVPFEKMAQIAQIEVSQINRQRCAAIESMSGAGGVGYTARRSKGFQETAARIGAEDRLVVEERIEVLLDDPRPEDAIPSNDRKTLVMNIPGTPCALTYAVDDSLRQIELLSLQPAAGNPHSPTK